MGILLLVRSLTFFGFIDADGATSFIDADGATAFIDADGTVG